MVKGWLPATRGLRLDLACRGVSSWPRAVEEAGRRAVPRLWSTRGQAKNNRKELDRAQLGRRVPWILDAARQGAKAIVKSLGSGGSTM